MAADVSNFNASLRTAVNRRIAAALAAVDQFGEMVLGNAQELAPVGGGVYSPNDPAPGTLKASGSATPAKLNGTMIVKSIGFGVVYAARQHNELAWRHDQGQAQYLKAAMDQLEPNFEAFVRRKVDAAG